MTVKPTTTTRERILMAAIELFYAKGYAATGMAEILTKANANSGSFYFFFSSKESLLEAVLDWYIENLQAYIVDPVYAATSDPIERVFAVLEGYRQKILVTQFAFTCPIGRLALEIDPARTHVHEKIATNFTNWTLAIRQCLLDAGDRLPADCDRDELAQFVLTVMEGGVMQSRAHRDIAPFDRSVQQLRQYVQRLEQSAAEEKSGPPTPKKTRKKK